MILSNVLETVFGTPARIAILRRLALTPQPLSGRQLAELAGLSHRGAIQSVQTLVSAGVVMQRKVGRACQYRLSRENMVVEEIILPALEAESNLRNNLYQELAGMFAKDAVSIILFGSFARGEERAASDIDVLIVAPSAAKRDSALEKADRASVDFNKRYGALLSVYGLTRTEIKSRKRTKLVQSVLRDSVVLYGKEPHELIK